MDARDRPPPDSFSGWPEPLGVRVRDIGEIAAGLPHLLGFRPRESVVLVGLGGASGRRVGLTVRADIPPPEHAASWRRCWPRSLCTDRPDGALVLVVSEAPDEDVAAGAADLPHRGLVWEMVPALSPACAVPVARRGARPRRPVVVLRLPRPLLRSRRAARRCPTGVTELEVASIATGTVVAGDREDLVARIAPPRPRDRGAMAGGVRPRGGRVLGRDPRRRARGGRPRSRGRPSPRRWRGAGRARRRTG